ncbi:LOW QUALITY PROTEIN: hypothetical protein V2J09_023920 [Rumex salicifolius]
MNSSSLETRANKRRASVAKEREVEYRCGSILGISALARVFIVGRANSSFSRTILLPLKFYEIEGMLFASWDIYSKLDMV